MILSMSFALVFAIVLPVLTGTDPTMTVSAVIVLFVFVQTGFYLAIRSITPYDPVWYLADDIDPREEPRLRKALAAGAVLSVVGIIVVVADIFGVNPVPLVMFLPMATVPLPVYAVIPITPLAIPGFVIRRIEAEIKERDESFPSFIRALGAAETAKQSTTSAVLRDLRGKDFGPLTEDVNNLFKRLNRRLEPEKAWHFFAADAKSYLVQKFSEMYLVGRQMGGEPKLLGELISSNMNEVNQLRQRRKQATITLIGVLHGITAASTFAFFIGIEIVNILAGMSLELSDSQFD
jgi:flagellar protein FlaJ